MAKYSLKKEQIGQRATNLPDPKKAAQFVVLYGLSYGVIIAAFNKIPMLQNNDVDINFPLMVIASLPTYYIAKKIYENIISDLIRIPKRIVNMFNERPTPRTRNIQKNDRERFDDIVRQTATIDSLPSGGETVGMQKAIGKYPGSN